MNLLIKTLGLLGLSSASAFAVITIDFSEIGSDVRITVSGSYDSFANPVSSGISARVRLGEASGDLFSQVLQSSMLSSETSGLAPINTTSLPWDGASFTQDTTLPISGVGGVAIGDTSITYFAPTGYTAGDPINATGLFINETYVSLGIDDSVAAGTFTVTGAEDFNWTIGAVPEPSTYAALLGLAALGFVISKRRRKAA